MWRGCIARCPPAGLLARENAIGAGRKPFGRPERHVVKLHPSRWPGLRVLRLVLAAAGLAGAAWGAGAAGARPGPLHVPSPDWRDQVIYFVLTDRFADGDPRNNDQGAGEFGPGQRNRYNGGDFKGLVQRLDYIRGLGATAVWVTPPVANQWVNPSGDYTGYHGYWAEHFKRVDPHLGTLADYRALARALHGRGMYLVQDIVVNHTGNFYTYRDRWRAGDPAHGWEPHDRTPPVPRPSQPPFDRNDPRDPAQRAQAIYHWTPDVADYTERRQELEFQMAGLDDLNTENPQVRRALRESYGWWIRQAGVDAFRVDTAFYVPPEFFTDFLHAQDPAAPGIARVARATGRANFHVFGEGFGIDRAHEEVQARKVEAYKTDPRGRPLLPGMLNFPLYGTLGEVLARGAPTQALAHRIASTMRVHARPHLMPTFVDNHDVDRFLAGGSPAALRQALLAIFTLPGIPVVYYGTEQGFTEPRAAMFAAGWGSGGRDHYDTAAPLYRTIAALAALRRSERLFSRGQPEVLRASAAGPGALAWRMTHAGAAGYVALNSAEHPVLVDRLATGLAPGTRLRGRLAVEAPHAGAPGADTPRPADLVVDAEGLVSFVLPPRAGWVWTAQPVVPGPAGQARQGQTAQAAPRPAAGLELEALPAARVGGDFEVRGRVRGAAAPRLVIDGDLRQAVALAPDADGRFSARVDTSRMADASVVHRLVVWDEATAQASAARTFQVERAWVLAADVEDPAGDDRGPAGTYTYPTDPSWGDNRQMDLRRVRAHVSGGSLRLELGMHRMTTTWNPANGFDHVAFTIYLELPGQPGGSRLMPLQQGSLPADMRWHRRLRVHGWSNALFSPEGASERAEGTPVAPGALVRADAATHTVTLTLPAAAMGTPSTLSGARIYVTTWDYDGGYRALQREAAPFAMGGGDPARDARVMDDSAVITLP